MRVNLARAARGREREDLALVLVYQTTPAAEAGEAGVNDAVSAPRPDLLVVFAPTT
jgi:hypothetical protein